MDPKFSIDHPDAAARTVIAQARELTRAYNTAAPGDAAARRRILEALLGGLGEDVAIDTPFFCDYGKNIFLGSHIIININCAFIDTARITVGDHVLIASNVQIYTATHAPEAADRIFPGETPWFRTYTAPVTIEDGVWIGGGAILLPGVTIGRNSVIGAGSVVTRSIPDGCVAVGNPCRPIRKL